MTPIERTIRDDALRARKGRDQVLANLAGTVIGEIEKRAKAPGANGEVGEAEVFSILRSFRNNLAQTAAAALGASDDARHAQAEAEMTIVEGWMPAAMSEAEIEAFAAQVIADAADPAKAMPTVMARLKAEMPGRYDGKVAAEIVKRLIAATPR